MKRDKYGYLKEFEPTQEDIYSLDITFATVIYKSLRKLRKNTNSYPMGMTFKYWKSTLKKMEKGFQKISNEEHILCSKKTRDELEECLDLFRKYYFSLWW